MSYNNKNRNNKIRSRTFYALYIGPNNNDDGQLIFKLPTKQILVAMKYQPIHTPEDLIKTTNKEGLFNNKVQTNHLNSNHFTLQGVHFDNGEGGSRTQFNNENSSKDESYDALDSSQQLNDMEFNKIINQENQVLLIKRSNNSTSVSTTGLTSTSTSL